jgi:hypothetical protein
VLQVISRFSESCGKQWPRLRACGGARKPTSALDTEIGKVSAKASKAWSGDYGSCLLSLWISAACVFFQWLGKCQSRGGGVRQLNIAVQQQP